MKTYHRSLNHRSTKRMLMVSQQWGRQVSILGACLERHLSFRGVRSQLHLGYGAVGKHLVNNDKDPQDSENSDKRCLKGVGSATSSLGRLCRKLELTK